MTSAAFYGGGGGAEKSFELCFMLRLSSCDFIHIHRAHKQISRTSFLYLQDTKSSLRQVGLDHHSLSVMLMGLEKRKNNH